jgi:hypothetical protein
MKKGSSSPTSFLCLAVTLLYAGAALGAFDDTEPSFPAGKVLLGCKKGSVTFVDASDGLVTALPPEGSSCSEALASYEKLDGLVIDSALSYIDKDSIHILLTNEESLTITVSMARNVKS